MTVLSALLRWLVGPLAWATAVVSADPLATYSTEGAPAVVLLTERCRAPGAGLQQAHQGSKGQGRTGCWAVNARGNPVILWADGEVLEIDERRLTLTPQYERLLKDVEIAGIATKQEGPDAGFPRPAWCRNAAFPHEKLVCRDKDLAAVDLALSPLWRTYRDESKLNPVQQARAKSDYFSRLKACGANRKCIASEQASQMRFYKGELARLGATAP